MATIQDEYDTPTPPHSASMSTVGDDDPARFSPQVIELKKRFPDVTLAKLDEILRAFQKADKTNDGLLDKSEFLKLLESVAPVSMGCATLFQRLAEIHFKRADRDQSGTVDLTEFLQSYNDLFGNERRQTAVLLSDEHPELTIDQIEAALKRFEESDLDGNGLVDIDEFYQLKEDLAPNLSKVVVRYASEQALSSANLSNRDQLTRSQFLEAYTALLKTNTDGLRASRTGFSAAKVFDEFKAADSLDATIHRFTEVLELLKIEQLRTPGEIYAAVKAELGGGMHNSVLYALLDKLKKSSDHCLSANADECRAVIIGAGPAGLRMAIELALLGVASITVVEKRAKFSRHNLLHLWPSSIRDLKNIGAKFFFPKLCTGGIDHVSIRRLQLLLLKIALVLGVRVYSKFAFDKAEPLDNGWWRVVVKSTRKPPSSLPPDDVLTCNVLIGAEGCDSQVAQQFQFEHKTLKGREALGVTANFVNTESSQEKNLREFGLSAIYDQQFFRTLKDRHGIELENLVYYRGETHYFVMTVKRACLSAIGVAKDVSPAVSGEQLCAPSNINKSAMQSMARNVALYVGLPDSVEFALDTRGNPDVAIFDFSKKKQCVQPLKVIEPKVPGGRRLLVALVGDALVEPFWPQGTGLNRAILSVLDNAWMVKVFLEKKTCTADELVKMALQHFKIMACSAPEDLQPNFGMYTMDPKTRYKKTTVTHFH